MTHFILTLLLLSPTASAVIYTLATRRASLRSQRRVVRYLMFAVVGLQAVAWIYLAHWAGSHSGYSGEASVAFTLFSGGLLVLSLLVVGVGEIVVESRAARGTR
jgi:multisubunit Na+/H+ antiporter MnhB subunit